MKEPLLCPTRSLELIELSLLPSSKFYLYRKNPKDVIFPSILHFQLLIGVSRVVSLSLPASSSSSKYFSLQNTSQSLPSFRNSSYCNTTLLSLVHVYLRTVEFLFSYAGVFLCDISILSCQVSAWRNQDCSGRNGFICISWNVQWGTRLGKSLLLFIFIL